MRQFLTLILLFSVLLPAAAQADTNTMPPAGNPPPTGLPEPQPYQPDSSPFPTYATPTAEMPVNPAMPDTIGGGDFGSFNSPFKLPTNGTPYFQGVSTDLQRVLPTIASNFVQILEVLAGILAVLYLLWAGIQYIISAGNADRIKSARAGILNVVIGVVVIVATYFIVKFAVGLGNTVGSLGS